MLRKKKPQDSFKRGEASLNEEGHNKYYIELKNHWLLERTYFGLTSTEQHYLEEFNLHLQAAITSLLSAIKVVDSNKIDPKASTTSTLIDAIIAIPLNFIPEIGSYVSGAYSAIGPAKMYDVHSQKSQYHHISQWLKDFTHMDEISGEFSALVTSYYQADIIKPSQNISIFEEIKKTLAPTELLKKLALFISEKFKTKKAKNGISSVDRDAYKSHWASLIEYIVVKFLVNATSSDITYSDFKNNTIAIKLSQSLTPVSNEALSFNLTDEFNLSNTYALGRISQLVYKTEHKIDEITNLWKYKIDKGSKRYRFFFAKDIQGLILADSKKIIISFRGTHTVANVFTDLNFRTQSLNHGSGIKVHAGFWEALNYIWPAMKDFLQDYLQTLPNEDPLPEIWFAGHSLGGALATLAAFTFINDVDERSEMPTLHLYTFGQPKCGNQAFADFINNHVPDYQRFINYFDIFPILPFNTGLGYVHGGQAQWLNAEGKLHDENAYEIAMQKVDEQGKKEITDSIINRLFYTKNHIMIEYLGKLGTLITHSQPIYSYASYADKEFQKKYKKYKELNDEEVLTSSEESHNGLFEDCNDDTNINDDLEIISEEENESIFEGSDGKEEIKDIDKIEKSEDEYSTKKTKLNTNQNNNSKVSLNITKTSTHSNNSNTFFSNNSDYNKQRMEKAKQHFVKFGETFTNPCKFIDKDTHPAVEIPLRVVTGIIASPFMLLNIVSNPCTHIENASLYFASRSALEKEAKEANSQKQDNSCDLFEENNFKLS